MSLRAVWLIEMRGLISLSIRCLFGWIIVIESILFLKKRINLRFILFILSLSCGNCRLLRRMIRQRVLLRIRSGWPRVLPCWLRSRFGHREVIWIIVIVRWGWIFNFMFACNWSSNLGGLFWGIYTCFFLRSWGSMHVMHGSVDRLGFLGGRLPIRAFHMSTTDVALSCLCSVYLPLNHRVSG